MGLDVYVKGLAKDESREELPYISIGYIGYGVLMRAVARAYYGEYMGGLYVWDEYNPVCGASYYKTPEDVEAWNLHCDDNLDIWLFHADNRGKFTPKECKGIYRAIKDLCLDDDGLNAYLELFKTAFKHCAKRRVNLYYR